MKIRLLLLLFHLLLLFCQTGFSQNDYLSFQTVPGPKGGLANLVAAQDPKGYIWFGSYGLHRYDGYNYVSYFHKNEDSNSLGQNKIEAVYAAHNGMIWIGLEFFGLDRFDPATGGFRHFRHKDSVENSLSNDTVTAILEDKQGSIWIGTRHGLNKFDPHTEIFTHYEHNHNDSTSLSHNHVRVIYEDRGGVIWVGTGSPFAGDDINKGGGLNKFDKESGVFKRYMHDPKNEQSLIDDRVRAIFEDSHGIFWIGTAGDGLHTMDRKSGIIERHQYNPAYPGKLSRPPLKAFVPWSDPHITFITEDAKGAIWIGTFDNGMNRYDPVEKTVTPYSIFINSETGTKADVAWEALIARDGTFWVITWEGIFRTDPIAKGIPFYHTRGNVRAIFQDRSGTIWYGDDSGLVRKDANSLREKRYLHDPGNLNSITSNDIQSIFQDREGRLWIGTANGLNKFDSIYDSFTRYIQSPRSDYRLLDNIQTICDDDSGNLWIAPYRSGLHKFNPGSGLFTKHMSHSGNPNSLSGDAVICLYKDRSGILWAGTEFNGLNAINLQTGKINRFLEGASVTSLLEDSKGTIWAGTLGGIFKSQEPRTRFTIFSGPGTEIPIDIMVTGILEDDKQSVWFHTSLGEIKLNPQRDSMTVYRNNQMQILRSTDAANGYFKSGNGQLFMGGAEGYFAFYPQKLKSNPNPPQIVINEFRLSTKTRPKSNSMNFTNLMELGNEIILEHQENTFSIEFAGIHFSDPNGNRHYYKLEGLNDDWIKASEEKLASFYNLPSGHYRFLVKVANSNGIWAEKGFPLFIKPPWWLTSWAYVAYFIMLVIGIYLVHQIQKQRVIRAERERTHVKELAQAREIEKAYLKLEQTHETLKSTQAQLIQSEKMASLGELTAGIAHEIQNPLNFVNNFSEINKELLGEMKNEMEKGNLEEVKTITNSVIENEEKIKHHGSRADAIVKSMLQHSRTSTGQKEPTDLSALADEYLRLAYHGLRAKDKSFNVTLKTEFDPVIGKLELVPQDIGRVMLNLYNNSFYALTEKMKQASQGFEPIVTVSTQKLAKMVELRVKDNGNGIPQKILDKIFQPFFTTKPAGQGTGLGLSLSYDIVTKGHGGVLKVETAEGEGTCFIIQLPIA